jgi:hypothetical protein
MMSWPPRQRTRFDALESRLGRGLIGPLRNSWRAGSLAILALLAGFFLSQNLTTLLLASVPGGRPAMVLATVLMIELLVRLRSRLQGADPPLGWVVADNLRIGATYGVVLEAFKLGT